MGDNPDFLIRDSEDLVDVVKYKSSELPVDRVMLCSILALSCGTVEQALRASQEDEEVLEEHLMRKGAWKLLVTDIGIVAHEKTCRHVLVVKGDRGGIFAIERLCDSINGPYPFEVVVRPVETRTRRNAHLQEYSDYTFIRSSLSQGRY